MKILPGAAVLTGLAVLLGACGADNSKPISSTNSDSAVVTGDLSWEEFDRLSYEDRVHRASAILVIRYDIDSQGNVTPIVTHRKSRLGSDRPPFQVGDTYMTSDQKYFIETLEGELRHLGEGAVLLFQGDPPQQRDSRIIREGAVSGTEPVPVEAILAGFDGVPIANGDPADVLTLEPDFEKGETSSTRTTVNEEEKEILVGILESHGLRYEVAPQGAGFVVGWIGSDEAIDAVFEEFIDKCL